MTAATANMDCAVDVATCGQTMIDVIKDKYLDENELAGKTSFVEIYVPSQGNSCQSVPNILTLDNQNICQAGNMADLQELCSHVVELDLTLNSLQEWSQIFTILDNLPKLEFLNLTSNPLSQLTEIPCTNSSRSYIQMRSLVLNKTRSSWDTVQFLLSCMPNLKELHLSLNDYHCINMDRTHNSLQILHLNANQITDWREVVKLGQLFPTLTTLILAETGISELDASAEEIQQAFPSLKNLNITKTSVNEWEQLEKLNHFPSLQSVRLLGIPLLNDIEEKLRRQLVVASIGNVTKLNGSSVSAIEREDAERAYIRYYMSSTNQPARYFRLEEKYGKLDPLVAVSLKPKTDVVVAVEFEDRIQNMKINVKQTVLQLKKQLKDLTGLPASKLRLFYRDVGGPGGEEELRYPSKYLYSLNIRDGDEIVVVAKPQ